MTPVPARFLVRLKHPCPYVAEMPREDDERLLELPESGRLVPFEMPDHPPIFADVRLGWNEMGIGVAFEVRGKEQPLIGDPERPRLADGLTLWIDTRDTRSSHRASRYCHQFHLLPSGGGSDRDEAMIAQSKIHRAIQDAPIADLDSIPYRLERRRNGYRMAAFLNASTLTGFEPEHHRFLGIYYAIRDAEFGEQTLSVSADFPFAEDPSLWETLELLPPN